MRVESIFKHFANVQGIYCIINTLNNKRYIGGTQNVGKRLSQHLNALRRKNHANNHLQYAWNKYGEQSFNFLLIETVFIKEEIYNKEQYWMDFYHVSNDEFGYNICPQANKSVMSDETRKKISQTKKGIPMKEETKIKLSLAHTGKKRDLTIEQRKAMGLSSSQRKGCWKHSEETKKLISQSRKGKKAWNKGLSCSEKQKEILRNYRIKNPTPRNPSTGRFLSY